MYKNVCVSKGESQCPSLIGIVAVVAVAVAVVKVRVKFKVTVVSRG